MNLIFLGPPGSGKGTQAMKIAEKFGLIHLSTGNLLREAVKENTVLGQMVDGFISQGKLIPDNLIIDLIEGKIASGELSNGFILDGFPRTIPQAESLKEMLEKNSIKADHAVLLKVSNDTIVERIKLRVEIEGRDDDNEEVVRKRLNVYGEQTKPIEEFYRNESIMREIDGEASLEEVFDSIVIAVS